MQHPSERQFLTVPEVAERLRCSVRRVHELTRTHAITHRRLPGSRRCLFLASGRTEWVDGAPLDHRELPDGGRVVRPKSTDGSARTPRSLPESGVRAPNDRIEEVVC